MPHPAPGTTIRHELGQAYLEWDLMAAMLGYIGLRLMMFTPVGLQASKFPKVKLASLARKVTLDDLRRGPDGAYNRDSWEYEEDQYTTEEYGKEERVDRRLALIAAAGGLEVDQIAADRSVWFNMHALEQSIIDEVTDDTTYAAQATAASAPWDDPAAALPIDDVKEMIEKLEERNALPATTLAISLKQARNALLCEQVANKLGFRPSAGLEGEQLPARWRDLSRLATVLADVFGIPEVMIADGFRNTANAGVSPAISRMWPDDKIAVLHRAMGTDIRMPGFGRVMSWTGDTGGQPIAVEEYWIDAIRSDVIRARMDIHKKVIHSELLEIKTGVASS